MPFTTSGLTVLRKSADAWMVETSRPGRRQHVIGLVLGQVFLLACRTMQAAPQREAPSFTQTAWHVQDGLPENPSQAIQQVGTGDLWVGTTGGAVRFDGARFTPIPGVEGSIFSMLAAKDGTVWLGTEGSGLLRIRAGATKAFSAAQGLLDGFVRAILEDKQGRIWIGTDNGVFWIEGDVVRQVNTARFGNPLSVHALMQDTSGRIWIGGSQLIVLAPPLTPERVTPAATQYSLPGASSENRVKSMLQTTDGSIWIGTVGGLDRLTGDHFKRVGGIAGTVRTMRQTADGSLWVGTIGHGLYLRRQLEAFTRVRAAGQGVINTVLALYEDDSHQLWVGSQDGLFRMRQTPIRIIPFPGDTPPDFATLSKDQADTLWAVSSRVYHIRKGIAEAASFPQLKGIPIRNIFRDRSNSLWFGTDGDGLYHQTAAALVHYLAPARLVNNFVRAFLEASDGTFWIATDEGVSHLHDGRTDNLRMSDGLAYFSTRCLLEDRSADIWIGTERGLSHWHQGRFVRDPVTAALAGEKIWSILQTSDGSLWFGTRDHGLYHQTSAGLDHFTMVDGLASDTVYQMLEGTGDRLWMSSPTGLSSFLPASLNQHLAGERPRLATTVYDLAADASGIQMYGGRQPAGVVDSHGAVWFPSTYGAVEAVASEPLEQSPPRVRITGILADGQSFDPAQAEILLPPSLTRLQVSFAPLLLRPQSGVRFRYQLEGLDTSWIDAGTARTASFTSLPAGPYRFRIQVFEADRPSRVSETAFTLRVRRHLYTTFPFLAACLLLCALLAWGIYVSRLRQIRLRFEAVIEERTRLAREMHDTVIQGCTGVSALLEAMSSLASANQPLREDLLDHARTQVRSTIDEARQAVWNLRHQAQLCLDLPQQLERLAAQVQQDRSTRVVCLIEGPNLALPDFAARELLMVVREAAYNAVSHAAPQEITICLRSLPESLTIEVRDDGNGFVPRFPLAEPELHYGIAGMRERMERLKGDFTLSSKVGEGTLVRATLRRTHLVVQNAELTSSL